jgi:hypothetical protein
MARQYLFICNVCGATEAADSERLPDGWAVIVAIGVDPTFAIPRSQHFDLCSRDCAFEAFTKSPRLALVSPTPRAQLTAARLHTLASGGDR